MGEQKVSQFPSSYRIWRYIVRCAEPRWGGSYELIEKLAETAQAHVQANPRLSVLRGYPHWARGRDLRVKEDNARALAEFNRALSFGIEEDFLRARMSVLLRLDRYGEAIADARRLVELYPDSVEKDPVEDALAKYRRWTYELHRSGNSREAIVAYTELIAHAPDDAELPYWRAVAHDALGETEDALAGYRRAIELDPEMAKAYKAADRLLARQHNWDEVLVLWGAYIALRPDDAEGYIERGGANFHKGDYRAAHRDAQRACDLGRQEACVWAARLKGHPAVRG